jgi:hypothetical protein
MKTGLVVYASVIAAVAITGSAETGTNHLEWGSLTSGFQMAARVQEVSGLVQCWVRNGEANEIEYNDYYLGIWGQISIEIFDGGNWKCLAWPTIAGPVLSAGPSAYYNTRLRPMEIAKSRYAFTGSNPEAPTFEILLSDLDWPTSAINSRSFRARAIQFLLPVLTTNQLGSYNVFCVRSPEFELHGEMIHKVLASPEGLKWGATTNGLQMSARVQPSGTVECWIRNGETKEVMFDDCVVGGADQTWLEVEEVGAWKRLSWSPTPATLRLPTLSLQYNKKRRLRPLEVAKNLNGCLTPHGPQSPTVVHYLANLEWPTNLLAKPTILTRAVQELKPAVEEVPNRRAAVRIYAEFELDTAVLRKALAGPRWFVPPNHMAEPKTPGRTN